MFQNSDFSFGYGSTTTPRPSASLPYLSDIRLRHRTLCLRLLFNDNQGIAASTFDAGRETRPHKMSSNPGHDSPTSARLHLASNLEGALLLGQTDDSYRKIVMSKACRAKSLKRLEALVRFADEAESVLARSPRTCREWVQSVQELMDIAETAKAPGMTPRPTDKPRYCACAEPCLACPLKL